MSALNISLLNKISSYLHLIKGAANFTEAMKMETTVQAPFSGVIKDVHVKAQDAISVGDLLIEFKWGWDKTPVNKN